MVLITGVRLCKGRLFSIIFTFHEKPLELSRTSLSSLKYYAFNFHVMVWSKLFDTKPGFLSQILKISVVCSLLPSYLGEDGANPCNYRDL